MKEKKKTIQPPALPRMAAPGLSAYRTEQVAEYVARNGITDSRKIGRQLQIPPGDVERAMRSEEMALMVQSKLTVLLTNEAAPLAVACILGILGEKVTESEFVQDSSKAIGSPRHDARLRLRAAELVINKTIFISAPATEDAHRDLAELSADALHTMVEGFEMELAKRARPIEDSASDSAAEIDLDQPIDLNRCLD